MSATAAESAAGRQRLGLPVVVLALAQLVISLDYSIVYVALPEIGAGLGFSAHDLQWVVSAYVVTTGGFLLLGGRAADLLGRRRMFVLATAIYAASSLIGGLAESPGVLLAVRAAQGMGGSLLFPATLSLINTTYAEGPVRNRALAIWGAAGAGGLCFGSLLGGVLVHRYGWPAVFLVNVPLALALAVLGRLLFPADPPRDRTRRFDAAGALTATAELTLVVFLLVYAPATGWARPASLAAAAAGLLCLALFAVIERRAPDPLMPVRLFRHRGLVVATAVAALFSATFSSLPYFLTLYFQAVRGYDSFVTGLCFLLPALVVAAGTQAGAPAVARFGMRRLLVGGLAAGAVGALALSRISRICSQPMQFPPGPSWSVATAIIQVKASRMLRRLPFPPSSLPSRKLSSSLRQYAGLMERAGPADLGEPAAGSCLWPFLAPCRPARSGWEAHIRRSAGADGPAARCP
ncbi:MFS transporter [Streptomyces sp. NPDC001948]